jgi:hypothetical protein
MSFSFHRNLLTLLSCNFLANVSRRLSLLLNLIPKVSDLLLMLILPVLLPFSKKL